TTIIAWRRRSSVAALEGPNAAAILLAAWLSCYHFMYYDVLLTALPCSLLYAEPLRLIRRIRFGRIKPWRVMVRPVSGTGLLILLGALPIALAAIKRDAEMLYPPVETFCLLVIWAWCMWNWEYSVLPAQLGQSGGHIGRLHERLTNKNSANVGGS
ncbi:MAG: hypothetical protein ACRD36_05725, partial [Candidatus Acidiferrum sp.]